jgi:SAM-dependent methyltransferase
MPRRNAGSGLFASALSITAMSVLVSFPRSLLPENDASLEQANQMFWSSLLAHIKADVGGPVESILDVGCHHGGLLAQLAATLHPKRLTGIEPSEHSRERTKFRLRDSAPTVAVLSPERWCDVATGSVDLITCHEVLHLVEDLPLVFHEIARTLRPQGGAFVVAGCHSENPVWPAWSAQLRTAGQTVFDRAPFDILRAGINADLRGALRPLRRDGWVIYDPDNAPFKYSSAEELLDHQYRHKLLFRFLKEQ